MLRCSKIARRRALPNVYADASPRVASRLVREIHSSDRKPDGALSKLFGFGSKGKEEGLFKQTFSFFNGAPSNVVSGPEPKLPPHLGSAPPPPPPQRPAREPSAPATHTQAPRNPVASAAPKPAFVAPSPSFVAPAPSRPAFVHKPASTPSFVPPKTTAATPPRPAQNVTTFTATYGRQSGDRVSPVSRIGGGNVQHVAPGFRAQNVGAMSRSPIIKKMDSAVGDPYPSTKIIRDDTGAALSMRTPRSAPSASHGVPAETPSQFGKPSPLRNGSMRYRAQRANVENATSSQEAVGSSSANNATPAIHSAPSQGAIRAASIAGLPIAQQFFPQGPSGPYRAAAMAAHPSGSHQAPSLSANPMAEFMKPAEPARSAALSGNPMGEFMKSKDSSRSAALSGNPMAEFMKPAQTFKSAALSGNPMAEFMKPTEPARSAALSGNPMTESMKPAQCSRPAAPSDDQEAASRSWGEEQTSSFGFQSVTVVNPNGTRHRPSMEPKGGISDMLKPIERVSRPVPPRNPEDRIPSVHSNHSGLDILTGNSNQRPVSKPSFIFNGPPNFSKPQPKQRPAPVTFSAFAEDVSKQSSTYFEQAKPQSRTAWSNYTDDPVWQKRNEPRSYSAPSSQRLQTEYSAPSYRESQQSTPRYGGSSQLNARRSPPDYGASNTSQWQARPPVQRESIPSSANNLHAGLDAFGGIEDLMGSMDDSAVVSAKGSDDRVIEPEVVRKPWNDAEYQPMYQRQNPGAFETDSERLSGLSRYTQPEQSEGTKWGKAQKQRAGSGKDKFVMDLDSISIVEQAMKAKADKAKKKASKKRRDIIPLYLPEFISVEHLASTIRVPMIEFMEKMRQLGFENVSHDEVLNAETAGLIAMDYNYELIVDRSSENDLVPRPPAEDTSIFPPRPPVVTIMGHVDHGKTTLLDFLRKSSIAAGEHGGITQHIGAFSVKLSSDKIITFLDTPGHAAFLSMRQRGANVTDIVILVVAADDSVMPQTIEAIKHAKGANVPIIVAVNKMDKPDADAEKVKLDLGRHGVDVEDFGGDTQVVEVSGKTGLGMDSLEDAILTLSEMQDHHAEQEGPAEGWVIEASKEKRGRVATVLVKRGTLRPGDIIVAGTTWARVRTLRDEAGTNVTEALPGYAVEVDGWREQPEAGDIALGAETEARARNVVALRKEKEERMRAQKDMEAVNEQRRLARDEREAAEAAKEAAKAAKRAQANGIEPEPSPSPEATEKKFKVIDVPFIVKADVSGSAEAVINSISAIGNEMIRTKILRSGIGEVSEFDIDHAAAAEGYIVAFNVDVNQDTKSYARQNRVEIIDNNIIYRLENDIKAKLESLLPPIVQNKDLGVADIMQVFGIKGKGGSVTNVAGVKVRNGSITRNAKVRVTRNDKVIFDGKFSSLKHLKQDVQEMRKGGECGLGFEGWQGFLAGDIITCYESYEQPRKL